VYAKGQRDPCVTLTRAQNLPLRNGGNPWARKSRPPQKLDLTTLSFNIKIAFFINLYNALVMHGFLVLGPPSTLHQVPVPPPATRNGRCSACAAAPPGARGVGPLCELSRPGDGVQRSVHRKAHLSAALSPHPRSARVVRPQRIFFYNHTCYNLGGYNYCLNDIEHGLLRGNKKPRNTYTRMFTPSDPRLKAAVLVWDPRIHFALVRGSRSCPVLRVRTTTPPPPRPPARPLRCRPVTSLVGSRAHSRCNGPKSCRATVTCQWGETLTENCL
jgi:hypothetical protein